MQRLLLFFTFFVAGCAADYEYKDCGVFYERPEASPVTNQSIPLTIDNWGDVMTVARGIPPNRFVENNACILTGEFTE